MNNDTAVFWMCVAVLLAVGLLLGQFGAVAIGAMAAVVLAHQRLKDGTEPDFEMPGLYPAS